MPFPWEPDQIDHHADPDPDTISDNCSEKERLCLLVKQGATSAENDEFGRPDDKDAKRVVSRARCILKCEAEGMERPPQQALSRPGQQEHEQTATQKEPQSRPVDALL